MKTNNTICSEQFQKSSRKIKDRGKIDTPNSHIHDRSTFLDWYRHLKIMTRLC